MEEHLRWDKGNRCQETQRARDGEPQVEDDRCRPVTRHLDAQGAWRSETTNPKPSSQLRRVVPAGVRNLSVTSLCSNWAVTIDAATLTSPTPLSDDEALTFWLKNFALKHPRRATKELIPLRKTMKANNNY